MHTTVFRILGIMLGLFSTTMLPPMLVAWITADGEMMPFAIAFAAILGVGVAVLVAAS